MQKSNKSNCCTVLHYESNPKFRIIQRTCTSTTQQKARMIRAATQPLKSKGVLILARDWRNTSAHFISDSSRLYGRPEKSGVAGHDNILSKHLRPFNAHFQKIWRRQLVLDRFSELQEHYYGPMAIARRSIIAGAAWQTLRMMT